MRERRLLKPVEGAGLTFQAPLSFGLGVGVDLDEPGVCRRVMSLIFLYFYYSLKRILIKFCTLHYMGEMRVGNLGWRGGIT